MKEYCTRETIRRGWLKCVLDMELVSGKGIGLHPRVQAAALNEQPTQRDRGRFAPRHSPEPSPGNPRQSRTLEGLIAGGEPGAPARSHRRDSRSYSETLKLWNLA